MRPIPVFSVRVAKKLLSEGFIMEDITNNSDYAGKLVFHFQYTEEIKRFMKAEFGIVIR